MNQILTGFFLSITSLGFSQAIHVNQVGYYPESEKIAVAVDLDNSSGDTFEIIDVENNAVVFTGTLQEEIYYNLGDENTRIADFTTFNNHGKYKVKIGEVTSYVFDIANNALLGVLKGSLKSYYYNRCSSGDLLMDANYAGKWTREGGHSDDVVYIHSSARANTGIRYVTKGQKGWYDAGDYNKYIVNAGITMYTMLAMYERYEPIMDTLNLNIPESNNGVPDVLDEALWNLRWMLGMQDPTDGGVFHKLSNYKFGADVMPNKHTQDRYVTMKSTAATLDFAAVMAQASRVYKKFPSEFPGLADSCISAAEKAWNWAQKNENIRYIQDTDFETGQYGDSRFADEKSWAASELYITTAKSSYYDAIDKSLTDWSISWNSVYYLGVFSLHHYQKSSRLSIDSVWVSDKIIAFANRWLGYYNSLPYKSAFGTNDFFYWGSNAIAGNAGVALAHAYDITEEEDYRLAALSCLDYMLGKNPTGYSFMTGFGSKYPMNPHHRISIADGVLEPIPGMVVNGVNKSPDSNNEQVYNYPSATAKKYMDVYRSHSTNEPAINYTIPFSYLALVAEAKQLGVKAVVGTAKNVEIEEGLQLSLYPNPVTNSFTINSEAKIYQVKVLNLSGQELLVTTNKEVDVSTLEKGLYLVSINTEKGMISKKIVID